MKRILVGVTQGSAYRKLTIFSMAIEAHTPPPKSPATENHEWPRPLKEPAGAAENNGRRHVEELE